MAKTKPTTLKAFFDGRRRKAILKQWTHLKTRAGEPRIKLEILIPMLNEDMVAIPEPINEAFIVMAKDASKVDRTTINIQYLGMTVEAFTSDQGGAPAVSCTGGMLHKFALVSQGEGEKREVNLQLVAYLPANVQLRDWAWDHNHGGFFMTAEYSQTEMEFTEAEAAEIEEAEEEEEEIPAAEPTPKKKSGPKELAAYHEAHPDGEPEKETAEVW